MGNEIFDLLPVGRGLIYLQRFTVNQSVPGFAPTLTHSAPIKADVDMIAVHSLTAVVYA
ncbi:MULTISPECIES: hypothetical protein [unclassified Pseudomonas]|uniref:hypothetical protein n=1 Tax=unclassified Pseudomonas TaxID=196821 RepID=UPI00177E2368|nr:MULTISPECIES: hypothetical protein [unclassified Pseudomonas]MBD8599109.1 hypothetical protein [Pseudomonas sp. CFBP 8772]